MPKGLAVRFSILNTWRVGQILCSSLVGRASEVSDIRGALDAAGRKRQGSAVFVLGEAGVGKSRLVKEAIAEARARHFSVLFGRAAETATPVAFRPLTEALFSHFRGSGLPSIPELEPFRPILGRLVPEWRSLSAAGPDDSIILLAEALLRLLRGLAGQHGLLLVLEDLHWADAETNSVLEYLADNLGSDPILCLSTVRSDEPSEALHLGRALVARRTASVVELERLSAEDVSQMARACLGKDIPEQVDTLLHTYADGLPFFVEELLAVAVGSGALTDSGDRSLGEGQLRPGVPFTFAESVRRRLVSLGEGGQVVIAASVLGRRFDWSLLPEMTGRTEHEVLEALRSAVDVQLLVCEPRQQNTFRFRHALARDAVMRELLPAELADLSASGLAAIERAHPGLPGEWCEVCAQLAIQAHDRPRAAGLLLESGRRAHCRGALASAETALESAREFADRNAPLVADVEEALCEVLSVGGSTDRALEAGGRAVLALSSLGAPAERLAAVHLRLSRCATFAMRWEPADSHLEKAKSLAATSDDALAARINALSAHIAIGRGDPKEAAVCARSALEVAGRLQLPEVECEALEVIGRCARLSDLHEAEATFETARRIAEAHGLQVWQVRALSELVTIDLMSGRSRDRLTEARDLVLSTGALPTAAHLDLYLCLWFLDRFEIDQAIQAAGRCSYTARRLHMHRLLGMALACEAAAYARLGRQPDMESLLSQAFAAAGDEADISGVAWGQCRAILSLIVEKRRAAIDDLDRSMECFRRLPTTPPVPTRGLWALLRTIEDTGGESACAEVRTSGVTVHFMARGYLHLADAVQLGRAGRRAEAEEAFAAGDRDLVPVPWHRHHARRLVAEPAINHEWGDPVTWIRTALPQFEAYGHDRITSACRSLLRKAGAPVPRQAGESGIPPALRSLGVTRREAEVLNLLAEGLLNKQIAERLYLSPRTVERHIANMTTKANLHTRSELIAFAARMKSVEASLT